MVEAAMGCYQSIIAERLQLRLRCEAGQRAEAVIGVAVLNRMRAAGRPNAVRRAILAE